MYNGPMPLMNHGAHRYFYQIVALKRSIVEELEMGKEGSVEPSVTYADIVCTLKRDDIAGWGEWIGTCERTSG